MDGAVIVETPIANRAIDWVEDVLSGRVPACRRAKLACRRFKADLKRAGSDEFPFVFDVEAAEHLCAFVEAMPHIEGEWAARGETIELDGWQAFLLSQIAGWVHVETGLRRFRKAYIEVPRKNGKSTLLGGVGLYFLGPDGEPGAKVFSAASSAAQARIVFDCARVMALSGDVDGVPLADVLGFHVEEHKIKNVADPAAVFQPIASQTKSKDGKNPHCAIVDELHEHEKRDVWDSMASALGAREQPLLIAITTAGSNTAGVCFEQRRYVERILDGVQTDESFFGLIFEADEGDEPGDEATWYKANPGLGRAKKLQYLRDEWVQAAASPAAMGEFLRKHLDIWTSIGAAAIDLQKWDAGGDASLKPSSFAGQRATIGIDLATRNDFAEVVVVLPEGNDLTVFGWHFLPEAVVNADGNEHYWAWADAGLITTTPGASLDLNVVEALVLRLCGKLDASSDLARKHRENLWQDVPEFDVEMVVFDPMYASQMAATWEGEGIAAVELRQRAGNLNVPFNKLIGAVDDVRVRHAACPVAKWQIGNTLQKVVSGGDFIYPARRSPEDKIDFTAALVNALWPLDQAAPEDDKKKVITKGFIDV